MAKRDIWWDASIHRWVETVRCTCKNGYVGIDGHTCPRCSGSLYYDIPSKGPIQSLWDKEEAVK